MPGVSEHFEHADSDELAQFGYKQELDRSLGSFSSFAAGFSYISILTGVFQLFGFAFLLAGPAFFWSWPIVFIGQFLVALCFAELAGQYPAGGIGLPVVEADGQGAHLVDGRLAAAHRVDRHRRGGRRRLPGDPAAGLGRRSSSSAAPPTPGSPPRPAARRTP